MANLDTGEIYDVRRGYLLFLDEQLFVLLNYDLDPLGDPSQPFSELTEETISQLIDKLNTLRRGYLNESCCQTR